MASKKISELTAATALQGDELFAVVQSAETKKTTIDNIKNYSTATAFVVEPGQDVDLNNYPDTYLFKLTWSGAQGTVTYTLPNATTNVNRFMRFITDSSFDVNTRVDLTPASGQTLDGSSDAYEINKAYEGIALWSDGTEWFIVQKKA